MLPVHNSIDFFSRQYLLQSLVSDHVLLQIVTSESGRYNIKQTLWSKCFPSIIHFLTNGSLPAQDSVTALRACHFEVVYSLVNNLDANCDLGLPLSLCRSGSLLHCHYRTTFSFALRFLQGAGILSVPRGPLSLAALTALQC